jgi:hypothetical protein
MKTIVLLLVIVFLTISHLRAQIPSLYPEAQEKWSKPKKLDSDICRNLVRYPVISPNGKRLFFQWWTGGDWFAFFLDWDNTANDRGPV